MKKALTLVILTFLIGVSIFACSKPRRYNNPIDKEKYEENNQIIKLWESTVRPYLSQELWETRDIYDAGHFLMVPLHYAYESDNEDLIKDFEQQFDEFIKNGISKIDISQDSQRLSTLHYYYLISRYVTLANNSENDAINTENVNYLARYLLDEVEGIWTEIPAWQWNRKKFEGGMKERILWKLENSNVEQSYYRAIIDEEFFTLAIAADLKQYFPDNDILNNILEISYTIFETEGVFDDEGRWLFQPGVMKDHPDYLFVGYGDKDNIKEKAPLPNIATDSSHFHRFPLWIKSLTDAHPEESKGKELFLKISNGLEKQFYEKVLVKPDEQKSYYRLKNFMDGQNGVYRWDYTTSKGNGYGPYELSGTFTIGWWTFLGTDRIKQVYLDLSQQFPLPQEAVELYIGPNTIRDRNLFIEDPDSYYNGYKELLSILSTQIK